jgi:hypothetical protein
MSGVMHTISVVKVDVGVENQLTMSFTGLLKTPKMRQKFKEEFAKPSLGRQLQLLVPPQANDPQLVGTAFDYLLRFYIKQQNPQAITQPWVAENVLDILRKNGSHSLYEQGHLALTQTKEYYAQFLKTGEMSKDLIRATLKMAKLDVVQRDKRIAKNIDDIEEEDVEDLSKLIGVVKPNTFKTSGVVVLNPTFGLIPILVGGADADLVMDDCLIDIKTVNKISLERDYLNQVIGYYLLSKIEGIDGVPSGYEIKKLGIYFSRCAELIVFPVEAVVDSQRLPQILEWFKAELQRDLRN